MTVLALVEHDGTAPGPGSLEALTLARELAAGLDVPLEALLIGEGSTAVSSRLGDFGVSVARVVEDPRLAQYVPGAWAACLTGVVRRTAPRAVIAAGSIRGHELLSAASARLGLPMAAGCVDVRAGGQAGEPLALTRQRWAGSLLEEAEVAGPTVCLAVAEHVVEARPAPSATATSVEPETVEIDPRDLRVRLLEKVATEPGRVSLADARVVVGGGRGVGGPEGFAALEELAALLGGTVGVSRVVTSAGWRPHADQVGQTGTRIAPDLYIACGISGAIQHIVGCRSAKAILAINTDPEAPIMTRADYAVVGDLHAVVPAIIEEIRRAQAS